MFRPRTIVVLLLKNRGLVKSVKFKKYRYIGDPINAVKLFNDLKADELVFLDILASRENRTISIDFVRKVGEEANMPFAVGGGIKTVDEIKEIIAAGAEKVVINTAAGKNPDFIQHAAQAFGSSTIVVCIDVKKKFGKEKTWILNGSKSINYSPIGFASLMEKKGAGEIIVQSIDLDGTMIGYDINLLKSVTQPSAIPVVALGGAGTLGDLKKANDVGCASAFAAGSMFVYHGSKKGILINYPTREELLNTYENEKRKK